MLQKKLLTVLLMAVLTFPAIAGAFQDQDHRCQFEGMMAFMAHQAKLQGMPKAEFDAKVSEIAANPEVTDEEKGAGIPALKWGFAQDPSLDPSQVGQIRYAICTKQKQI